jgi:hypothetical protein
MGFRPEEPQVTLLHQALIALHALHTRRHRLGHVKIMVLDYIWCIWAEI